MPRKHDSLYIQHKIGRSDLNILLTKIFTALKSELLCSLVTVINFGFAFLSETLRFFFLLNGK